MERPRQFWRPETCTQGLWGHVLPLRGKRKLRVSKLISFLKCWAALVVRLTVSNLVLDKFSAFYAVSVTTLANALPWPMCWFFRLKCQFPVAYFLSTCWPLLLGKKGQGRRSPRRREDKKRMSNSVGKANVEFVKGHSQNVSVQLRAEDGITPPWNQVACLLEFYWFKQNSPWRQLGGVSVCPMSNPKPSPMFLFVNSFYPRSCSDWLPLSE